MPETIEQARAEIDAFRRDYEAVRSQIGRVIVGNSEIIDGVLVCLFCAGNALLEGVPGLGKTLLVRTLARALALDFRRIQFTPDLMPADITGTTVVREVGGSKQFVFEPGPVFTQLLLADEINRATPKTQSALLEAMQERSVTAGGQTRALPKPFFVMATQNPIEQEGVYPLPEAQLDRFFFKLNVGYASREDLNEVLRRTTAGATAEVSPVLDGAKITAHQALVRRVAVADHVQDYAVRLTLATHPTVSSPFSPKQVKRFVRVGASPRAAQALVLAAKCRALIEGRAAASIEDIKRAALPALRHRIVMNFEGDAEGLTSDAVVENLVATVAVQG